MDAPGKVLTGGTGPEGASGTVLLHPSTPQVDERGEARHTRGSSGPPDSGAAPSSLLPEGDVSEGGNRFPCLAACSESISWAMVKGGGDESAPNSAPCWALRASVDSEVLPRN